LALQVFKKVDYNKNGQIEPLEVEVAILSLYNIVNKRLPGDDHSAHSRASSI
jgi:hypothetical protein